MNTDFLQYNDKFYINYLKIVHERNMPIIYFSGALPPLKCKGFRF